MHENLESILGLFFNFNDPNLMNRLTYICCMIDQNNNDSAQYKWGIFYYNPNDKRIFPPKRNKNLGWTINFANPYSILAFVALIGIILTITKLIK